MATRDGAMFLQQHVDGSRAVLARQRVAKLGPAPVRDGDLSLPVRSRWRGSLCANKTPASKRKAGLNSGYDTRAYDTEAGIGDCRRAISFPTTQPQPMAVEIAISQSKTTKQLASRCDCSGITWTVQLPVWA